MIVDWLLDNPWNFFGVCFSLATATFSFMALMTLGDIVEAIRELKQEEGDDDN